MNIVKMPRILLWVAGWTAALSFIFVPTTALVWFFLEGHNVDKALKVFFYTVPVGVLGMYLMKKRAQSLGITKFVYTKTGLYLAGN